jgi:hypothetical protein
MNNVDELEFRRKLQKAPPELVALGVLEQVANQIPASAAELEEQAGLALQLATMNLRCMAGHL